MRASFHLLFFATVCAVSARDNGGPAGRAGVDGETTCLSCHRGLRLNKGGGNVVVTFPGSFTYTPGVTQRLRVTVTDTANAGLGFQVTARMADAPQVNAGSFSIPAAAAGNGRGPGAQGGNTVARSHVTCWNGDLDVDDTPKPGDGCPASAPIESVTHTMPIDGVTGTWEFDYTPPSTNAGQIRIYAAGNAVVGPEENNSRVYTASWVLDPVDQSKPEITAVSLDAQYGAGTKFSSGTWVNIQGTSLAATLRGWSDTDFTTTNIAPTRMDGVQVLVSGKPAFLSAVSAQSVRALLPADLPTGTASLSVKVGDMVSAEQKIDILAVSPYVPVLTTNGKSYARAQFATGGFVSPPITGGGPGAPGGPGGPGGFQARQAGAGDALIIQAIGLGPVANVALGQKAPANVNVPNVTVKLGDKQATVTAATMVQSAVGTYQISFTVPDGLPAGEVPMVISVNGVASTQDVLLPTR